MDDAAEHLDAGPGRRSPERTCIVTRIAQAPDGMIRFVRGPDDVVVPDLRAKLPGRGAWVSARRESVATAVKKKLFQRAFKGPAQAGPDLPDRIARLLRDDLRQAMAMAKQGRLHRRGLLQGRGSDRGPRGGRRGDPRGRGEPRRTAQDRGRVVPSPWRGHIPATHRRRPVRRRIGHGLGSGSCDTRGSRRRSRSRRLPVALASAPLLRGRRRTDRGARSSRNRRDLRRLTLTTLRTDTAGATGRRFTVRWKPSGFRLYERYETTRATRCRSGPLASRCR